MTINKYGLSFFIFGFICLFTAWVLSSHTGSSLTQNFPSTGGKFGPIEIRGKNEVVEFEVAQRVGDRHWSAIEAKVVDAKDKYLFSFSEELWFQKGYDADGAWQEGKSKYAISVTFAEPGNYFVNFSSTKSQGANVGGIRVEANKKVGSSIAYLWLGCISLIIGVAILYFSGDFTRLFNRLENTRL
jgi:hypothetical protein